MRLQLVTGGKHTRARLATVRLHTDTTLRGRIVSTDTGPCIFCLSKYVMQYIGNIKSNDMFYLPLLVGTFKTNEILTIL